MSSIRSRYLPSFFLWRNTPIISIHLNRNMQNGRPKTRSSASCWCSRPMKADARLNSTDWRFITCMFVLGSNALA